MPVLLESQEFLDLRTRNIPILDVRSPGEFMHAHIPGALNFPLFDDEERSEIGTLYKQVSSEAAMVRGLEFVGPKMAGLVRNAGELGKDKVLGVHCARGGKRSESMAWLLENSGFQVYLLRGGYKLYRRHVLDSLDKGAWSILLLSGMTGSRKTEVLKELAIRGEQVLDLETLANHKGSAFGHIGQEAQPGYETFENILSDTLNGFDTQRVVWVEGESRHIGRLMIPQPIWDRMRSAPLIHLEIPAEIRLENILQAYGDLDRESLISAFRRVRLRMGPQHSDQAIRHLEEGDVRAAARIALDYYDRLYGFHLKEQRMASVAKLAMETNDVGLMAEKLLELQRTKPHGYQ